jgi:two-component system, NarL family, response regulator LiaR
LRRVLLYGLLGGAAIALLKVLEYKHFVHAYPTEIYGGIIAAVFAALGVYLGLRWRRAHEPSAAATTPAAPTVAAPQPGAPFVADAAKLRELGITPREHEILRLIADGLSNREIGEKAFISENTVKTHSSRLFDKLGVSRRVQAVQRARELGLVP